MIKKLLLFVVLTFWVTTNTQAQDKQALDSLMRVYSTAKHDTTKIMALVDIAQEYRNSKPDTCIALATHALTQSEKMGFERGKGWSFYRLGMGNVVRGKHAEALDFYQKAMSIFEKIRDKKSIGNVLNSIGGVYLNQSNYPLALEYCQKSLKISEELASKRGIGLALNSMGSVYSNQGNYPLALEYYQKSLKISEEIGNKQGVGGTLNNMGNIYKNQGNYHLALEYSQKALKIGKEIGNKQVVSHSLNIMGGVYNKQNNYSLALEHYQESLKIKEEIGDKWGKTYSLKGLAEVYQKQKDFDKAIEYAQKSLQTAREIRAVAEIAKASQALFQTHKLKDDYVKALEYYELYKQTNDSIFSLDKSMAIANLEAKADIEKKQGEIAIFAKDKELDKQKQEVLAKDLQLERIEAERQKSAKLALEQQAKADKLFALARHEHDQRKQDSLSTLAQKSQLLADNLKVNELKLRAESKAKQLEILQEKEAKEFQQYINYLVMVVLLSVVIFTYFIFKSRQKEIRAKELIAIQKEKLTVQAEQLLDANNSKDKLFAILGHDLRSPVTTLEGFLALMQRGVISTEEFQAHLPIFYTNVKNLQNTLNNLLQWSISQMNGINAQPVQVNTKYIIAENISLFTTIAEVKNITFTSDVPTDVFVWADENHFHLLLRNLINNAIKFTPEGGQIKVTAQQTLNNLEVSITDNGVGMTKEQTAKLFKKNQNFTTRGTSGETGTGLGLELCQEIVAKNGGKLWVISTKGEGSTFTFSLPMRIRG